MFRRNVPQILALLALCTLLWCHLYARWSIASWQVPVEYAEDPDKADAVLVLASIKAASEGHLLPLFQKNIPELGAPFTANWSDYPGGEEVLTSLAGLLARCVGLFAALNLALLAAHLLAAVAFYFSCRIARAHWAWSMAGAIAFSFSRYGIAHGAHHLALVWYWHIPLCILVCSQLARRAGIQFGRPGYWFAIAVAIVTGLQNVYYTNMFVQLALLAGGWQWIRRTWKNALPAASIAGTALLTFIFMRLDTFVCRAREGFNGEAVARSYSYLEYYALKFSDLIIPPPDHRLASAASFSQDYFSQVLVPGETPPACYLGVVGVASLILLASVCVKHLLRRKPGLPLEAWQLTWIGFYSSVGGLNAVAGACGFLLFRSTTRYSLFILTILLLFAVRRLSLLTRLYPGIPAQFGISGAALCVAALAIWDQTPAPPSKKEQDAVATLVASDRSFTENMEQHLAPGARVFQLPVMEFPESPEEGVPTYDHFRPYLYSKHLAFSFGAVKGRQRDEWQQEVASLPATQLVASLLKRGFSAIYINCNGYKDKGGALIQQLQAIGAQVIRRPNSELVCVVLNSAG